MIIFNGEVFIKGSINDHSQRIKIEILKHMDVDMMPEHDSHSLVKFRDPFMDQCHYT